MEAVGMEWWRVPSAAIEAINGIVDQVSIWSKERWVCRPENATVRAVCLELLGKQLGPLKQMEAAGSLLPQVCILLYIPVRKLPDSVSFRSDHFMMLGLLGTACPCRSGYDTS